MTMILLRRGTTAEWTDANTVLASGEPGFDETTGVLKIGDGSTPWLTLDPINGEGGVGEPDLAGLEVASFVDESDTDYTVPLYAGSYTPIPNMVMGVPPSDRQLKLEFGGHFLCTVAGTGTIYLGISDVSVSGLPLEQCCNFRSGTFAGTGFAAIVGSLVGGHLLEPSDEWRMFALSTVLFRDGGSMQAVLTGSSPGGVGTTVHPNSRPPWMRAVLA